jgi:putative redox protein
MERVICRHVGELRCEARLERNDATLVTDATKEDQGRDELFSPTDLLAAALGNCTLTVIAMVAQRLEIAIDDVCVTVSKKMAGPPKRRVGSFAVNVAMPAGLDESQRKRLEAAAGKCAVHNSFPEEMTILSFSYPND